MPHSLRGSKLHEGNPVYPVDAPGVKLCSSADSVEVHGAMLLEASQRLARHTALADHRAHAELADDVGLVRLLANAGRRAGRGHLPAAVGLLGDYRTAVVDHAAVEIDWRIVAREMVMHRIASGERATADQHDIADLQG